VLIVRGTKRFWLVGSAPQRVAMVIRELVRLALALIGEERIVAGVRITVLMLALRLP